MQETRDPKLVSMMSYIKENIGSIATNCLMVSIENEGYLIYGEMDTL